MSTSDKTSQPKNDDTAVSISKVVEILRLSNEQLDGEFQRHWYSVFHNRHRERWLYVLDVDTGERWLGGDETDWENIWPLDGSFLHSEESEGRWIDACEQTASEVREMVMGSWQRDGSQTSGKS